MAKQFHDLTILVVEDEYLLAHELADTIGRHGGNVLGPVADIETARDLLRRQAIQGAILDVKLEHGTSLPLAQELIQRGTPVIFTTGYATAHLPEAFTAQPRLTKPVREAALLHLVSQHFRRAGVASTA